MQNRIFSTGFTGAVLCALLSLAPGCGPSINQAAKADIDRRVVALSPGSAQFAPPQTFEPRPLAVGQWAEYRSLDEDGKPSFTKQKIVGQEGNAFWFEIENDTYYGKTALAMLLDPGDRRTPDSIQIKAVKQRDAEGRETELPPELLSMMRSMWNGAISSLVISWQNLPQEDATVPAGRFARCYKLRSDVAWGPWKSASHSWGHPDVPISGTVQSKGIDEPFEMVLVAFGDNGARSVFASLQ